MSNITALTQAERFVGLSFADATNQTSAIAVMEVATSLLGNSVSAFQLGNEPDRESLPPREETRRTRTDFISFVRLQSTSEVRPVGLAPTRLTITSASLELLSPTSTASRSRRSRRTKRQSTSDPLCKLPLAFLFSCFVFDFSLPLQLLFLAP